MRAEGESISANRAPCAAAAMHGAKLGLAPVGKPTCGSVTVCLVREAVYPEAPGFGHQPPPQLLTAGTEQEGFTEMGVLHREKSVLEK